LEWQVVRRLILTRVTTLDPILDRNNTLFRRVLAADVDLTYRRQPTGERGFMVSTGSNGKQVQVPWSMLEECYDQLVDSGYSRDSFRGTYADEEASAPCIVKVIGQIFVKAKLAQRVGRTYIPVTTSA